MLHLKILLLIYPKEIIVAWFVHGARLYFVVYTELNDGESELARQMACAETRRRRAVQGYELQRQTQGRVRLWDQQTHVWGH